MSIMSVTYRNDRSFTGRGAIFTAGHAGEITRHTPGVGKPPATSRRTTMDNWEHRSSRMRCDTCIWFAFKDRTDGKTAYLGRCRKHAPTMSGFVPVFGTDWCGDHRLDENKTFNSPATSGAA